MNRCLAAVSVLAAAAAFAPAPAHAAPAPVAGFGCRWGGLPDLLSAEDGRLTADLSGGPLAVADGAVPAAVRMTCTLQVGGGLHTDADEVTATSPTTLGAAVLAPVLVTLRAPGDSIVYLCTRVDVDNGPSYYYDADDRVWTMDADVPCQGPVPV